MNITIKQTDTFTDQLSRIILYIADDTGDEDAALSVLERIEEDIQRLRQFPERGALPRYTTLRRQGYRVLITMRRLVFYKINKTENTVILYAITDHRREYLNLL